MHTVHALRMTHWHRAFNLVITLKSYKCSWGVCHVTNMAAVSCARMLVDCALSAVNPCTLTKTSLAFDASTGILRVAGRSFLVNRNVRGKYVA